MTRKFKVEEGFLAERIADPEDFDPRSFRTVKVGSHRVTIGCPRGRWNSKTKRCVGATRAQRILHPKAETKRLCPRCVLIKTADALEIL